MASLPIFFVFTLTLVFASWVSANANGLSQEKDAVYPKVPVPVPAPSPPLYKAPPVKPLPPPTSPVFTPPPVKAPYTPVPPVKVPPVKVPPPSSPPVKPPSSPPPAPVKAPYTPSPPVKPPTYSPPPPAKAPYTPVPPPSPAAPKPPPISGKECYPECGRRCELHSRKNVCIRACVTCCYRCKCVPPGTYGNREVCGKCYTDMTTHDNRIKCP